MVRVRYSTKQWSGGEILPYNGRVEKIYLRMVGWRESTIQWSGGEIPPYNGRVERFHHTMVGWKDSTIHLVSWRYSTIQSLGGDIVPYNGQVERFYHTMVWWRYSTPAERLTVPTALIHCVCKVLLHEALIGKGGAKSYNSSSFSFFVLTRKLPFSNNSDDSHTVDAKPYPVDSQTISSQLLSIPILKEASTGENRVDLLIQEFEKHGILFCPKPASANRLVSPASAPRLVLLASATNVVSPAFSLSLVSPACATSLVSRASATNLVTSLLQSASVTNAVSPASSLSLVSPV
ncbi:hypothetical protein PoB_006155300 [Plakobranchus ocellatus]|uniref:Integrase catalytic domain-containing protein n=1 Tax=Plakobranchus ocellatus TaxID=259542 RepID=A0AAV4CT76_9GAST|nr:hypothetical protein PoB_006155300 [Plakobranchus ocellatus]